jgi:hypothetical protein
MDWISLIAFIVIITILGLSIYLNVENAKSMIIENRILKDKLASMTAESSIENSNGFLKFVTESRDWAFSYIEDVQQSISSLKTAVENGYPTEEEMKTLFNLLPENKQGENNE